jgi:AcrR family transcriptional regulator
MESSRNRDALIKAARKLFAARGYESVSVDEIADAAGLTKGAVYHQFKDKKDVFRVACEVVLGELVGGIVGGVADRAHHSLDEIVTGGELLFDAYESGEARRLLLLDAPTVLGFEAWTQMHAPLRTELAEHALLHLADAGLISRRVVPMLAHLLFGAFAQGVLQVAAAKDAKAASRLARNAYRRLAEGLMRVGES